MKFLGQVFQKLEHEVHEHSRKTSLVGRVKTKVSLTVTTDYCVYTLLHLSRSQVAQVRIDSTLRWTSKTSLSRQSIALVLTTKNNQTQHYIHQKHKRETEKLP